MERKNMVLLTVIAVATLLVAVVGATFAYFTAATATDSREDSTEQGKGTANLNTAAIGEGTVTKTLNNVAGVAGSFVATDVYTGHKEVAALTVAVSSTKGSSDNEVDIAVPFLYNVTKNELGNNIKVRIYKSETEDASPVVTPLGCAVHVDTTSSAGESHYSEKCDIDNESEEETFGEKIGEITLTGTPGQDAGAKNYELAVDHIKVKDTSTHTYSYYVIIEYYDTGASQNEAGDTNEEGKALEGKILVA